MHGVRQAVNRRKIIESDHPICGNCQNFVRASSYCYCKRIKNSLRDGSHYCVGHVDRTDRACYHYKLFEDAEEIQLSQQEKELLKTRSQRNVWSEKDLEYLKNHLKDTLDQLEEALPYHTRNGIMSKRSILRKQAINNQP